MKKIFRGSAWRTGFARFLSASLAVFCLLLLAVNCVYAQESAAAPRRILSLSPAATEILFDLGLGDRVVGVTRYCTWPPEARERPSVGDMMNVNLELVATMSPDLVVLSNMNEHLLGGILGLGVPALIVRQDDFEQICDSMRLVGDACGIADHAERRVRELRDAVSRISNEAASGARPRVLIVVGRDTGDPLFRKVYVAGRLSFYNDLLGEAHAQNAFDGDVPYAQMSREGLILLDPDVVIELLGEHGGMIQNSGVIAGQWRAFTDLRAGRDGNVALIKGDFTLRAGPRYPSVLEAFIRAVHRGEREIGE